MKQLQVKILCQVITAQFGTLNTGAIIRTDEAFAKHLVEDCGAAEYVKPPAVGKELVESVQARVPSARKSGAKADKDAAPIDAKLGKETPAGGANPGEPVQTSALTSPPGTQDALSGDANENINAGPQPDGS